VKVGRRKRLKEGREDGVGEWEERG